MKQCSPSTGSGAGGELLGGGRRTWRISFIPPSHLPLRGEAGNPERSSSISQAGATEVVGELLAGLAPGERSSPRVLCGFGEGVCTPCRGGAQGVRGPCPSTKVCLVPQSRSSGLYCHQQVRLVPVGLIEPGPPRCAGFETAAMRISPSKSKVIVTVPDQEKVECPLRVGGEPLGSSAR